MSKKSFTDGLESLFSGPKEKEALDTLAPPRRKKPGRRTMGEPDATDPAEDRPTRRSGQKTFSMDLDAFLADVLNESLREELADTGSELKSSSQNPNDEGPHGEGIDALIRSTLETSTMEITPGKTRRVTFFFDANKVEQLKALARQENIFMREMISRIVDEYMSRYSSEK
ncbi:MAG: hypothetical protein H6568_09085 [Lewinellaceae bacterium]|nr:hypothetical protein [Saprospiraceae bacterium]MCB9312909.1 hypothetical protein [Lewinellaceae bacterium]HRW74305.1 hypothetical protein [Saprospiraceae bacterium]